RQATGAPQLRQPARARASASQWPAFRVVGTAVSRPLHRRRPAPEGSFWEYRHSGPPRDRAAWGKYARAPSTLPPASGPSSAPRLGLSGQITCQTRAARSLVNDSGPAVLELKAHYDRPCRVSHATRCVARHGVRSHAVRPPEAGFLTVSQPPAAPLVAGAA